MSSLPNIIKQGQCKDVPNQTVGAAELVSRAKRASERSVLTDDSQLTKERQETILKEAMEQAQNIMENARSYTMNTMRESAAQMNEEAARIKLLSFESGFSQGLEEGRAEGKQAGIEEGRQIGYREGQALALEEIRQKEEQMQNSYRTLVLDLEHQKEDILHRFESDIEQLSIEIARKILGCEINEHGVRSIVTGALESYRNQEWAKIMVSPPMAQMLLSDAALTEELELVSQNIRIVAEEEMSDTDCKIDLPDRIIDAGVETQLEEIRSELKL